MPEIKFRWPSAFMWAYYWGFITFAGFICSDMIFHWVNEWVLAVSCFICGWGFAGILLDQTRKIPSPRIPSYVTDGLMAVHIDGRVDMKDRHGVLRTAYTLEQFDAINWLTRNRHLYSLALEEMNKRIITQERG